MLDGVLLTRDDLLRAARLNQLAGMLSRRVLVIAAVLGLVGFGASFVIADEDPRRLLIGLGGAAGTVVYVYGLMLIARYVALPLAIRRQMREQTSLSEPYRISWDASQLVVTGQGIKSETAWARYHQWREDDRLLLLYLSFRLYQVLPKRWFTTEQADAIRRALTEAGIRRAPLFLG